MAEQRQAITPLVDIQHADFAHQYELGVWWSHYGDHQGNGPQPDTYLVVNLKTCAVHGYFDGQHEHLLSHIGFYLGMIHGGVLSPQTGKLRPDVTTLVTLCDTSIARGYRAGREWFFNEAEPHEQRRTDSTFIERLRESITEMLSFQDSDETWNYSIGCVLGELSGQLFPETPQEHQHWEKTRRKVEEHLKRYQEPQQHTTDPVRVLSLQEV